MTGLVAMTGLVVVGTGNYGITGLVDTVYNMTGLEVKSVDYLARQDNRDIFV